MDRQSVGRLERIEIVKGASSAVYGSDAIGGVINMITRKPRFPLEASVTTSGGSLNRFDVRGALGFVKDKWSGFFEAERHKQNSFTLIPCQLRHHRDPNFAPLRLPGQGRLRILRSFQAQGDGPRFRESGSRLPAQRVRTHR